MSVLKLYVSECESHPGAKRVVMLNARAGKSRAFAMAIVALRGGDSDPRFTWGQVAMWLGVEYRDAWVIGNGGKASAEDYETVLARVGRRAA